MFRATQVIGLRPMQAQVPALRPTAFVTCSCRAPTVSSPRMAVVLQVQLGQLRLAQEQHGLLVRPVGKVPGAQQSGPLLPPVVYSGRQQKPCRKTSGPFGVSAMMTPTQVEPARQSPSPLQRPAETSTHCPLWHC